MFQTKIKKINQRKQLKGFTFIEAVVLIAIVSLVTVSFYSTFAVGIRNIANSKIRLVAVSLANQKMETIRSLAYDNIGTQGGIPAGNIAQNEDVTVDGKVYHINTYIHYIDDPFDGTINDSDGIPTDYKEARVTVKWGNDNNSHQQVFLVSTFVPSGVESSNGGGTLRINIMNSEAQGVSGANIHLVNNSTGVDLNTTTDSSGSVLLPGTPAGSDYQITVSKSGYETVTTLAPSPASPYNPVVDEHATVIEGSLNVKSIIEDLTSNVKIITKDALGNILANIDFNLTGGRALGTKVSDGKTGYNFNQDLTTDTDGENEIEDLSPGKYTFTLGTTASTNYELVKLEPGDDNDYTKFSLEDGVDTEIEAILADKKITSLFLRVLDEDSNPLEGATVHLYNATNTYDATATSDKYGQVYFPENSTELLSGGDYNLDIHLDGYNDDNTTVTLSDGVLLTKEETLTAS